jgi:hypothetical protein
VLELRLLNRVPDQAAALAFVQSKPLSVIDNISLLDYSRESQANAAEFFQTPGTTRNLDRLFSTDFVLSNRSVVSKSLAEGAPLFYKYPVGRHASLSLIADSGSVSVEISSTTIVINAQAPITWVGKTVREVVKEINDQTANAATAYVLYPSAAAFETGSFTATSDGVSINNASFNKVYAPEASTTDLAAAKDTIRKQIEVLVDSQKTNEVFWDIEVESYDTDGFIVYLYTNRRNLDGKSYQIRYRALSPVGQVLNGVVEVINALPELVEGRDYTLTAGAGAEDAYYELATTLSGAPALAIFGQGTLDVTSTEIDVTADSVLTSVEIEGKTLRQVAAELQEALPNHTISLLSSRSTLAAGSLETQAAATITEFGALIRLSDDYNLIYGPDSRIHPLLPYDEPAYKPWHPRVSMGRFSDLRYKQDIGYGQAYGSFYGGSTKSRYNYNIPDYYEQAFKDSLGAPYRTIALEQPILVSEKILRTRRFPLESLGSLELFNGEVSITDEIADVDLEQGFIFLNEPVSSFDVLSVNYVYEERSLVYIGVDVNPANNPGYIGKFIALYTIPDRVAGLGWDAGTRTVYHMIRDTEQRCTGDLASLAFSEGTLANPLLIGIYQALPTEEKGDVKFLDARPLGGGVKTGIVLENEARFVTDDGRWDGEPFDADQTLILEVPEDLFPHASGSAPVDPPFYVDHASGLEFMSPEGQLTRDDIQARAQTWLPAATFLVVEP